MRSRLLSSALVVLASVFVPASLRAEPVRIPFEMTLGATFGDPADVFGAPTQIGDRIRGSLSYDPTASDLLPGDPQWGLYRAAGTIEFEVLSSLATTVDVVSVAARVFEGFTIVDTFEVLAGTFTFPGFDYVQTNLLFRTAERTATTLPVSAAEFRRAYQAGSFFLSALQRGVTPPFDRGTHEFRGSVRLLEEPSPVPEPASLLLVAGGLGVLARRRRHGITGRIS